MSGGAQSARPAPRGPARLNDVAALARSFAPGESVFLQGAGGEVDSLIEEICAAGRPLALTTSLIPGINPVPASRLPAGATITNLFAHSDRAGAQGEGILRTLPLSYSGFVAHLRDRARFGTCVIQVAPPDADGRCSLGIAVEFALLAAARARRVIGIVNPRMPRLPQAESLAFDRFDAILDHEGPLRTYDVGAPTPSAEAIARNVAPFIRDGATLQVGLGKVPDALTRLLTDRRHLRLFSGMLSDGARMLHEAGALDGSFLHTSCVQVGTQDHYEWLAGRSDFAVRGCDVTHDVATLARLENFVAVNSALTVDLFGQANLEMLGGRMVSGVGGAPDFARGAKLASGGISIVALPATAGRNEISRIVPAIGGPASLTRADIDVIVTEHGAADLRGLSVIERAERIVAIAAPHHRAELELAAGGMAKNI